MVKGCFFSIVRKSREIMPIILNIPPPQIIIIMIIIKIIIKEKKKKSGCNLTHQTAEVEWDHFLASEVVAPVSHGRGKQCSKISMQSVNSI
jgi:hypothetical protein